MIQRVRSPSAFMNQSNNGRLFLQVLETWLQQELTKRPELNAEPCTIASGVAFCFGWYEDSGTQLVSSAISDKPIGPKYVAVREPLSVV